MKAAQISAYGDASAVQITEVETPVPADGQVLVEVHAGSLNPWDSKVRAGEVQSFMPLELPVTLGGDIAGVVAADAGEFKAGDKVYGQAGAPGNSGAFAEYAATSANQIAVMPANLDFQAAASLPLVGISAWQALVEHLNLQAGQKLFIHGGAGGIGTIAVQIAKHIGAYVATTATGDGIATVTALGADQIIDFKTQDFAAELHDFDAVFDTVGHGDFVKAFGILKRGGRAVTMIDQGDEAKAAELGITAIHQGTKVTTEKLDALRTLVEAGVVKPQVGKVFPLADIQAAFKVRESGTISGKVVLAIRD